MSQKNHDFDSIRPLLDLASEEVLSNSDEEIRARAAEEGVDMKANANALRSAINKQMDADRLARLTNARAALDAKRQEARRSATEGMTFEQMLARLGEIASSGMAPKESRLMLAFRDGKKIDEDDLRSLLEDYEELRADSQHHEGKDPSK